jgi:hypothetical protein
MPDDIVDGGVEQEVDSQAAPESQVDDSAAPDAPVSQAAPQQVESSFGPYSAFRSLPVFQGKDDQTIARTLYGALEREQASTKALAQYRQVLPVAQEYLAHRDEFQKWRDTLRQQPQQPQAPQPQEPAEEKWWSPPPVRDAYKRYLVKDDNGREVIHPEAPLDARHSLTEFLQYKADFAQRFLTDPESALGPMVTRMAQQQAESIVRQQFETVEKQNYVSSLERDNADWLFDGQSGNVSREGQIVQKYIEEAKSLGISTPQSRWQYALNNTERDLLIEARAIQDQQAARSQFDQQLQATPQQPVHQAPPAAPAMSHAEANMDYLRRAASRSPSRAGVATNSPQVAARGSSFAERLKQTLSDEGLM